MGRHDNRRAKLRIISNDLNRGHSRTVSRYRYTTGDSCTFVGGERELGNRKLKLKTDLERPIKM